MEIVYLVHVILGRLIAKSMLAILLRENNSNFMSRFWT